jgi:hypothetical protein
MGGCGMMKQPILLKQLSVLKVKPDDLIVLMYDGKLPERVRINLEEMVRKIPALKENHVLILEDGLKIGSIRRMWNECNRNNLFGIDNRYDCMDLHYANMERGTVE